MDAREVQRRLANVRRVIYVDTILDQPLHTSQVTLCSEFEQLLSALCARRDAHLRDASGLKLLSQQLPLVPTKSVH